METLHVIEKRRSIRKFNEKEIPKAKLEKILQAGIDAPSSKNRQPWKFIVITEKSKAGMIAAMRAGIEQEKQGKGLLPESQKHVQSAEHTLHSMEQAPVTVFVMNTKPNYLWKDTTFENKIYDVANVQSIGAAIENMILAAEDMGLGSLWICDVFFAYRELCQWLGEDTQMIAAVSFGYPDETPHARPRKAVQDVVEWR